MIKTTKTRIPRVRQGDIIRDVEYVEYVSEKAGIIEVSKIVYPLVIVLTQDCDLEQDHTFRTEKQQSNDKLLMSVLVAPLYNAEHVYQGEHLKDLDITMAIIAKNNTPGKTLRQNQTPRYHYLTFKSAVPIVPSVIDFKHFFTVNASYIRELKRKNFVCTVSDLFREDISLRFANFLARIALPVINEDNTYR